VNPPGRHPGRALVFALIIPCFSHALFFNVFLFPQIQFNMRHLVAWWHSFGVQPSYNDLFQYLLDNASVWRVTDLDDKEPADFDAVASFALAPMEWRAFVPNVDEFVVADPFWRNHPGERGPVYKRKRGVALKESDESEEALRTPSPPRAKRQRTHPLMPLFPLPMLEEEAGVEKAPAPALCSVCHLNPCQLPHALCAACRLAFVSQNLTPPGKIRNRKGVLCEICRVCKAKPVRAGDSKKCSSCSYKSNPNPCTGCGRTGTKLARGLCNACSKRAKRQQGQPSEEDSELDNL
jgi:hypothetical protein